MKQYLTICLLAGIGCVVLANLVVTVIRTNVQKVETAIQSIPAQTIPPTSVGHQIGGGAAAACATTGARCERALLGLLNAERAAYGVPPLALSWSQTRGFGVCAGSRAHSRAMASTNSIWHDNPSFPAESFPADLCPPYSAGAENVGMGFGQPWGAIQQVHQLMMAEPHSPGCQGNHACSIISPSYSRVGIGIVQAGGAVWITEDFAG